MTKVKKRDVPAAEAPIRTKKESNFVAVCKRLWEDKVAVASLGVILVILLASICAPLLTPYSPTDIDLKAIYSMPSKAHIFGCDQYGRDIFTRILYGGRYSLTLGFAAALSCAVIGLIIGVIAGYAGGWVDMIVLRICDIWHAIPGELLTIVIATVLGGGFTNTVICMAIGGIPGGIRTTRAMCLKERTMDYLEAAKSINCSKPKMMFKHMLPNVIAPTIVSTTMSIGGTIQAAAGLSYLGLGVQPPLPEWGAMLSEAKSVFIQHPMLMLWPGLMILIVSLCINLFGDGLRDALDPKLKT